jgi:ectoine hydroxylase-related dioxygenase (phytanoyl-CoA dioxygenase family)
MKTIWHTDFPYFLPTDSLAGALAFSFIGEVPERSGGTLVVEGSPRLVARFVADKPKLRVQKMKVTRQALMSSDPWLKALCAESDDGAERFMRAEQRVSEVPVRVVELTGEPGDIVVGHPWLLHTPTPNRGHRPRFMRVQRIVAAG